MGSPLRAAHGALLSLALLGLEATDAFGAEPPVNPWQGQAVSSDVSEPHFANDPVFISDSDGYSDYDFQDDYEADTGADLRQAIPAQFRSGGGMGGIGGGRTAASPARMTGSGPRAPQSFAVRLARAPNMMGDFIGQGGSEITVQGPSVVQSFTSFAGEVEYEPTGSFGNGAPVAIVGGFAEFALTGAFASGDATGVALISNQSVMDIGANTSFRLEVGPANGSGIDETEARSRWQAAGEAYLANLGSDPQQFLNQQKAAIIAQAGGGSFTPIAMQTDSVTFDFDNVGQAVLNSFAPDPSGPADPLPIGGVPSPDSNDVGVDPQVTDGELYFVTSEYLVQYGDQLFTPAPVTLLLPSPGAADIVGRVRLQDNNSPLPRDRVFFDYNYFHNVPLTSTGNDVNRFAPGLEKTFWNRQASVELRVPMAITLDNIFLTDGANDSSSGEFGNLGVAVKFLLSATDTTAWAAGLGVSAPTADDLEVGMADGTQLVRVDNDSPHLLPYLAVLYTPSNSNWYVQSFLTFDFDTTGSDVFANVAGTGLEEIGVWNDQHLVTWSVATGSWFYQNYTPGSLIKRIGWQAEAHYTETLNDADSVASGNFRVGNPNAELSLVNGTLGLNVHVGQTIITTGYGAPLTSDDRVFDGELRAFINRYF